LGRDAARNGDAPYLTTWNTLEFIFTAEHAEKTFFNHENHELLEKEHFKSLYGGTG
jgi:hypothetical protein